MKIEKIELKEFKPLQFSNISNLRMEIPSTTTILNGTNGSGKGLAHGTPVKTPGGWTNVEDLKVGDIVTAWDGTPSKVTGVFPQGTKVIYRTHFTDGRYLDVDDTHMWGVHVMRDTEGVITDGTYQVINTLQMKDLRDAHASVVIPRHKNEDTTQAEYEETIKKLLGNECENLLYSKHFNYIVDTQDRAVSIQITLRSLSWWCQVFQHGNGWVVRASRSSSDKLAGYPVLYLSKVEQLKKKQLVTCIAIDHPDKLYIAGDWIVTHNTTLLDELTPLPPSRSGYQKEGMRKLTLSHDNKQFVLTSDFSNRTAPHSFMVDGEEMNISGNTNIQVELVEKHFGYNAQIHDLMYCRTDMTRLGPAERKNLFLSVNPIDLKYLLRKYKGVTSKIKEYKSNLTGYHARRTELESKLLTPEACNSTRKNHEQLVQDLSTLDKLIFALDRHVTELRGKCVNGVSTELPSTIVRGLRRDIVRYLSFHPGMSEATYEEDIRKTQVTVKNLSFTLDSHRQTVQKLKQEIDEYSTHLRNTTTDTVAKVEEEISHVRKAMDELVVDDTAVPLSITEQEQCAQILPQVHEACLVFGQRPSTVWSPNAMLKVHNKLTVIRQRLQQWSEYTSSLRDRIDVVKKEMSTTVDQVPSDCTAKDCLLRNMYDSKKSTLQTQLDNDTLEMTKCVNKCTRWSSACESLGRMYLEQESTHMAYRELCSLRQRCTAMYRAYTESELFEVLKIQPSRVPQHLEYLISNSVNISKKKDLSAKYLLLQKELDTLMKSNNTSKDFLDNLIKEKTSQLQSSMGTMAHMETELSDANNQLRVLQGYQSLRSQLYSLEHTVKSTGDNLITMKSIEFYQRLSNTCSTLKNDINTQLREMDIRLKEQDILLVRYDEVKQWIKKIDDNKWKLELIAKALNPSSGIPHRFLCDFCNVIINNANYVIQQVFTYKLYIRPIDVSSELDFIFPVELEGGILVKDISKLSKGQRETVAIAFNLAMLIQMNRLQDVFLVLDEVGGALDPVHSHKLMVFLGDLLDRGMLQQLFIVNHNAALTSCFSSADVVVLKTDGALLPSVYNEHVTIN